MEDKQNKTGDNRMYAGASGGAYVTCHNTLDK